MSADPGIADIVRAAATAQARIPPLNHALRGREWGFPGVGMFCRDMWK
ncbi:MAG: hypothetical protein LBB76_01165 [Azoarcus sp.]|nr:hypothetical protein [Azoarcus sp.]